MSTLLTVALLALASPAPEQTLCPSQPVGDLVHASNSREAVFLRFAPEEGTVIRRTFDSTATYSLDEVGLLMDGEEPPFELPEPDLSIVATEYIVVVDTFGEIEEGRALGLSRSFDELAWTTTFSASDEEDKQEEDLSDLEGEAVEFRWDSDEEEYAASAADDSEIEDSALELLTQDMDLVSFLPEDEVESGDSWDLDVEAYLALVWPGGVFQAHGEDEEVDLVQLEMSLAMIEGIDFEGEASLEEVTEEDGRSVAVITFEMEVSSTGEVDVDVEEGAVSLQRELERSIEGRLLWDIEAGRCLSLEASAESELASTTTQSGEDEEGGEHELEQIQNFSGEVVYSITFEVQ